MSIMLTVIGAIASSGGGAPSPTYTLTPEASTVDEGASLTFNVGGTNIGNTTLYWTIEDNLGDWATTSGTVSVELSSGSFSITPTADATTEGSETFTVALRVGSTSGTVLATSGTITITDTSLTPEPTYTLTPAANNVDEGSSLEFTVGGTNITNGTYYWTVETSAGDFTTNTGEVSVTDNSGSFTVTPTEDSTTEGLETFTVALRSGSVSGSILQTSESITINDTSLAPPFSLQFVNSENDYLDVAQPSYTVLGSATNHAWSGTISSGKIFKGSYPEPQVGWILIGQQEVMYGPYQVTIASVTDGGATWDLTWAPQVAYNLYMDENYSLYDPALAVFNLGTTWTIEFWLKANAESETAGGGIWGLLNQVGWSMTNAIVVALSDNKLVFLSVANNANDDVRYTEPTPGQWTQVAIVNDAGTQKVFYNGAEQTRVSGNAGTASYTNGIAPLRIGRLGPANGGTLDGKMAMVRISNTAKYLTAFTPSTTYNVEADTVLLLDSDTPLIGQSYFELNGVTLSVNGGNNIYVDKEAYPNLDNQIQIGDTVVNVSDPSPFDSVVAGAVYSADPANWGVPITPGWGVAGTVNFSGTRSAPVTNNGVTISTDFPPASITITNVSVGFYTFLATVDFTANITQSEIATIFFEWFGGAAYSGPHTLQVNPGVNTYTSPVISGLYGNGNDLTTEIIIDVGVNACTSNIYTGSWSVQCLVEGTMITMADGSHKAVEDIGYNDLIRVWNFDLGEFSEALPVFVKQEETHSEHYRFTFSDGTVLRTVGHHVFNKQAGAFTMLVRDTTPVGTITVNELGEEVTLISKETIQEPVKFYNVWTQYHLNLFAQGILTSNRFNNIYPIQDMKFVKDNRVLRPLEEFANLDPKYISGLRLQEQPAHYSAEYIRDYVENKLERLDVDLVSTQ